MQSTCTKVAAVLLSVGHSLRCGMLSMTNMEQEHEQEYKCHIGDELQELAAVCFSS